jgi:hypothetical protein
MAGDVSRHYGDRGGDRPDAYGEHRGPGRRRDAVRIVLPPQRLEPTPPGTGRLALPPTLRMPHEAA